MKKRIRVEIYKGSSGKWYWRVVAGNGQTTRVAGQGFANKWNAKRSVQAMIEQANDVVVEER